ncbi:hypothetical protein M231_03936 [Tremella mesenterica]|uniref:Uncharacterized protein n=1 Tax=Tremella mesenterica TaxID=5217 RepID=A0A4Q1BM34_TREME|nr:uncharacterized protein TREMEDRAFT_64825 [Tremella mesenterica DSM 1558]EIW66965.1 hypothetical protein TREMEDRAFT_64825 [Tremella mesenterica DSM 1558]RXK38760.1 hypothetical protein M231_03936 [Tremella mesenterica]
MKVDGIGRDKSSGEDGDKHVTSSSGEPAKGDNTLSPLPYDPRHQGAQPDQSDSHPVRLGAQDGSKESDGSSSERFTDAMSEDDSDGNEDERFEDAQETPLTDNENVPEMPREEKTVFPSETSPSTISPPTQHYYYYDPAPLNHHLVIGNRSSNVSTAENDTYFDCPPAPPSEEKDGRTTIGHGLPVPGVTGTYPIGGPRRTKPSRLRTCITAEPSDLGSEDEATKHKLRLRHLMTGSAESPINYGSDSHSPKQPSPTDGQSTLTSRGVVQEGSVDDAAPPVSSPDVDDLTLNHCDFDAKGTPTEGSPPPEYQLLPPPVSEAPLHHGSANSDGSDSDWDGSNSDCEGFDSDCEGFNYDWDGFDSNSDLEIPLFEEDFDTPPCNAKEFFSWLRTRLEASNPYMSVSKANEAYLSQTLLDNAICTVLDEAQKIRDIESHFNRYMGRENEDERQKTRLIDDCLTLGLKGEYDLLAERLREAYTEVGAINNTYKALLLDSLLRFGSDCSTRRNTSEDTGRGR